MVARSYIMVVAASMCTMSIRRGAAPQRKNASFQQAQGAIEQGRDENVCDSKGEGELRNWKDKSKCLDVWGDRGKGDVGMYECTGEDDQQWVMCKDGTIRNKASSYCLDIAGTRGEGKIRTRECRFVEYPNTPEPDKIWKLDAEQYHTDQQEIKHKFFRLKSTMKQVCLTPKGETQVFTHSCQQNDDQFFYFTGRGEVLWTAHLINWKSNECLCVESGWGNALTYPCMDHVNQVFTFYQSGELVNKYYNRCLSVKKTFTGGDQVYLSACSNQPDQKWTSVQRKSTAGVTYMAFKHQRNPSNCLDVVGKAGYGRLVVYRCTEERDQMWRAGTGAGASAGTGSGYEVVKAKGKWRSIGFLQEERCMHVGVTTAEANMVGEDVGVQLSAGFEVVEVATSISQTWAREMSESFTKSFSSCLKRSDHKDHYVWQWQISADVQHDSMVMPDNKFDLKAFAMTENGRVEPKCLPQCGEDSSYQSCHNKFGWCNPCGWLDPNHSSCQ